MLLSKMLFIIIFLILLQDVTGIEKGNPFSDNEDYGSTSGDPFRGNEDDSSGNAMNNGSNPDVLTNYSDYSFYHELTTVTSNGVIKITIDVMLLSVIQLVGLKNISITGHNSPTVNCDNAGGIHFDNCHNCTVLGITWEKCGTENDRKPAIELYNSSNIIVQNCSFQHSVTQAIALSEMSGNVIINSCKFLFNNFKGHGTAIHYLTNNKHLHSKFQFTVTNCNFTHNGMVSSKSIVYMGPSSNKSLEQMYFMNSVFSNNQGVSLYISHQSVVANGNILFMRNLADRGGAIFITNHSKLVFYKSDTKFVNNKALNRGGALYIAYHSSVTFERNSAATIVNSLAKRGGALYIVAKSDVMFKGNCIVHIINSLADEGGALYILKNGYVTFEGNATVAIDNNQVKSSGGGFYLVKSILTFKENSRVTISNNLATGDSDFNCHGGALFININTNVTFEGNATVTINNNQAHSSGGALALSLSTLTFEGNSRVTFSNNLVNYSGGVLSIDIRSYATFKGNSIVTIKNNHANSGGALSIFDADVIFKENSTVTINNNQAKYSGGALYIEYSNVIFEGNSTITINNNLAIMFGGALYIDKCNVIFKAESTVMINNNQANSQGGALFINKVFEESYNFNFIFEENSTVTITNNLANVGGAFFINNNVTFKGKATVRISNNLASDDGGALSITDNSYVTFKEHSTVTINNNQARGNGGAIYAVIQCNIIFKENSTVTINNNQARGNGGAIYAVIQCNIIFKENSTVTINNNQARGNGGAIYVVTKCNVIFKENSTVTINNNQANDNGGALYNKDDSDIMFKQNSTVKLNNNQATYCGGAVHAWLNSDIVFIGTSTVTFNNNTAKNSGGALHFRMKCNVLFHEASFTQFYNNVAIVGGGALYGHDNSNVTFSGNTLAIFSNNEALDDGGALYSISNSHITFQENSILKFVNNRATSSGGALFSRHNSKVVFESNCTITFNHNSASQGGAIFILSNAAFKGNSTVTFNNNIATFGGALHISKFNVIFKENTVVTFNNNEAELNGGALYSEFSNITLKQTSTIIFTDNSAKNGGATYISTSTVLIAGHSNMLIKNNIAKQNGGAIHFNELISAIITGSSTITVTSNAADNCGGGVYFKVTQNTKYFNFSDINFGDNTARVAGNLLYADVPKSCNASCLTNRVVGISSKILQHSPTGNKVSTSPRILKLHYPAKCISNDSVQCKKYYIDNIMLGQEIPIQTCLLDYYNKPAEVIQFKVSSVNHQNYFFQGSNYTSISCNHTIGGITIVGNKPISDVLLNFSVLFTSYTIEPERKVISVNLTVGLSPCHPGFQYHGKSQRCECYNKSGIVYCSGSSSTIKRGYWFGIVNGRPTVTFCPVNYCSFSCCKTTNGYYDLSPERVNQCRSRRSGIACGSCEEGHTLSFDSAKCIDINKCFIGRTILVVTLTVLYWFAVVVTVFIITYYKVGIGYFYAVTYYYTLVDVLLSQNTDLSDELYIMGIIMSSIAKVTPQFLGQLCLFENMSGIDQQFIHYTHPLAVLAILIGISWLARHFKGLSTFISKGIIHAICFLLLLSYTSMATTSLLLMRSLTFADVDNVYTYLSPNIRYFHGRHLVYGITAIILTLLVVIGLPLLLLLEPFLNRKVDFIRIKPLLDQFQGCYKDKYRYFAAYYMICRLIIIAIIIANLSDAFISQYLLITVNTTIALIHLILRPYADNILNIFDAVILHTMVAFTVLQMFEYLNAFDSSLVVGIAFVLVILPLAKFVVMKMFASKQILKEIITNIVNHFAFRDKTLKDEPNNVIANNTATNHDDLIMGRNAKKCKIEHRLEAMGCRDPFLEVMKEIEDNNIL